MAKAKRMLRKSNTLKKVYKKRGGIKKGWRFGKMTVEEVASKAMQGVKMLKGLVNVEKSFINTTASVTPGSTFSTACLNTCSQGNDDINRKGDSILAKHVTINYDLSLHDSAIKDFFRVIVYLDKENRGANPAGTDLLVTANTYSQTNMDNLDRFIILRDERHTLVSNGGQAVSNKLYIPLDFHMKYAGNAGDVQDVRQNAIFIAIVGSENTNKSTFSYYSRLAFYDN